jgi:MinD-like ATPase involved in chromosome partitioning or flagellar assembly
LSRTSQGHLLVTVESPSGRRTLDVPQDARVDDLIPSLVEVCEGLQDPAGWSLAPQGEAPLGEDQTLGERGLFPGAVLVLVAPGLPGQAKSETVQPPASDMARRVAARLRSVGPNLPALAPRTSPSMPDIRRISDADYLQLLDAAITAPRSGASTVVAVMSAHAGAGTTTVTLLLATLLSTLRTDQVGAVDACPQSAALSHWMAPESGLPGPVYRSLFEPTPTPEQVRDALFRIGPGLALLPAPSDQRNAPAADEASWDRLIEHLRHLHNIVILDCGAGFHRAVTRAALGAADRIVLVSKSTPADLEGLGPTLDSIRGQGRIVTLVANQAAKRSRARRSASGVQQLTLAHEPKPAQRLKTRGFSWSDAPYSWQESMRELAAVLIGSGGPGS